VIQPTILIAGGGTGGHVFPAIAVAEAMQAISDVSIVFCGTAVGLEARAVPARGWALEVLRVEPMKGRGPARAVRASLVAARATGVALALVRRIGPRAVMGVGGYAAGPVTLAAALLRVPIALLEPNCVVGLANRALAPIARRAYIACEEAARPFRASARRAFGVPLRGGFTPRPYRPTGTARVLVMGGSQGAAALNERMPKAIAQVKQAVSRLEVVHQAGRDRDQPVREAYAREGVDCARVVPFLDDVAGAIGEADVVVARSGAGTIAEITAVGRASILVPFPHAADDHQARNAEALDRVGAALCLRQDRADSATLAADLKRLLLDDRGRTAMADAARGQGKPNAARDVAADLLELARVDRRSGEGAGAALDRRRSRCQREVS
jgi:UDP-N-acetylglucosamine--N-acetylmuramyl-(pentapeptide) pyrophosphoryl-undecaprenol N-acetylglucosamine transferase